MDEIISTIITFALVIGFSIIQSIFGKKNKKTQPQGDVLSSPFPEVDPDDDDDDEHTIGQQQTPQSKEKSVWQTIEDLITEQAAPKPQATPIPTPAVPTHNTTLIAQREELMRKPLYTPHQNTCEDNADNEDTIELNLDNTEQLKKAFVASLIFEKKF